MVSISVENGFAQGAFTIGALTRLQDIADGLSMVVRIPSFRRLALAGSLYGMAAYGIVTWMPVYYIRYQILRRGNHSCVFHRAPG